jgi:hypothetical protein
MRNGHARGIDGQFATLAADFPKVLNTDYRPPKQAQQGKSRRLLDIGKWCRFLACDLHGIPE